MLRQQLPGAITASRCRARVAGGFTLYLRFPRRYPPATGALRGTALGAVGGRPAVDVGVVAAPWVRAEVHKRGAIDGTFSACCADTGLGAARSFAPDPVIGIGEAAFHLASLIAGKFTVVTTLSRSVPAIEHNLVRALDAIVEMEFVPDGLRCHIVIPATQILVVR